MQYVFKFTNLHSHFYFFPENVGDVTDEHWENFIKISQLWKINIKVRVKQI